MPLFECSQCGCYDNTATSNYWTRSMPMEGPPLPDLCSECDPAIGKWHGRFPKQSAAGMVLCSGGMGEFLYRPSELEGVTERARIARGELRVIRTIGDT